MGERAMIDDRGVQSVRVAVALCERFTALLTGPSQVTARKQQGALLGFSGDQEALSMRIGEAQQLYPEIWRHLDDARAAFAERGVDVAAFDRVRAEEGQRLGANVAVDHQVDGFGTHAIHQMTKAANFNAAGAARARRACDALMTATPDVDWASIARAEANDPEAAAFARATRTRWLIRLGVIALVIALPFLVILYLQHDEQAKIDQRASDYHERVTAATHPLEGAARDELAAQVAQRKSALAVAHAIWKATATADILRAIVPGAQPCTAPIHAPDDDVANKYVRLGDADPQAFAASEFAALPAAAIAQGLPDDELQRADRVVAMLDRKLASGQAVAADRATLSSLDTPVTYVVIDKDVSPHVTQTMPLTYIPGEVGARAYVFSLPDARFICAATLTARNTPSAQAPPFLAGVHRVPDADAALHRELEIALRKALAANLRAIAP